MVPSSEARHQHGRCGRQTILLRAIALAIAVLLLPQIAASQQTKPNIVLVLMDNLGWGEPGAFTGAASSAAHRLRESTSLRQKGCACSTTTSRRNALRAALL
jgi:hypothetical protein